MPFEAALAHIELGRPADSQPQRQWHLEQAQTLLQELGAVPAPLQQFATPMTVN